MFTRSCLDGAGHLYICTAREQWWLFADAYVSRYARPLQALTSPSHPAEDRQSEEVIGPDLEVRGPEYVTLPCVWYR
jgi:hypothetical protein